MWDEIKDLGYDELWLKKQLLSQCVSNYDEVLLAEWLVVFA
ncbi:hypothetical protein [Paenibacillus selenitireducens]